MKKGFNVPPSYGTVYEIFYWMKNDGVLEECSLAATRTDLDEPCIVGSKRVRMLETSLKHEYKQFELWRHSWNLAGAQSLWVV